VTCTGTVTNQNSPNGYGTGAQNSLTINVGTVATSASVTGTNNGIFVNNNNTINIANGSSATGAANGIAVGIGNTINNAGSISSNEVAISGQGNLTVMNSGQIRGPSIGIAELGDLVVMNNGSISAASGSAISVTNGNATVTNSGQITGGFLAGTAGILTNSNVDVTNNAGGTISGFMGIRTGTGGSNVFNAGTITGNGGTAIAFSVFGGSGNTLTLAPTSVINGNVLGTGSDTFQLAGPGSGTFDLGTIGAAAQYQGFATFNVIGGTWTAINTFVQTQAWNVDGGVLDLEGTLPSVVVNSGGALEGNGTVTGAVTVNSGGTFAPGTPGVPGTTINLGGNLTFQANAAYMVFLNPTTSTFANVTGNAALNAALTQSSCPAPTPTRPMTSCIRPGLAARLSIICSPPICRSGSPPA
jgi:hypothetical protein